MTADDSASAYSMVAWRCWCSTKNSATQSSCKTCTAPRPNDNNANHAPPDLVEDDDSVAPALAFVVRSDLAMGAGKIATHCCSATLSNYWHERDNMNVNLRVEWEKQFLECEDDAAMNKLVSRATVCGIQSRNFHDDETGERTMLTIGPVAPEKLSIVTGSLLPLNWKDRKAVDEQGTENEKLADMRSETLALTARMMAEYRSKTTTTAPIKKKKMKPNDKCDCGSGLKFKKCCATKVVEVGPTLEDLVILSLGKNATDSSNVENFKESTNKSSSEFQGPVTKGEKVPGYRKQVEYGAKKYIKP